MNIKKLTMITCMAMCAGAFAKGIYFVSGGDFRRCDAYWKVITTEDNQTVYATPKINQQMRASIYDYSASIKIDNSVEFQLGKEELPRDGSSIIQRMQYTFPKAGIHTIKLYDPNTTVKRLISGESQSDPQETTIKELKFLGYSVKGATTNNIENYTCFNHVALEKVIIPEGVMGIGYLAFGRCTGLTKVHLPDSIRTLGGAFWNCSNLQEINIPLGTTSISGYFCQGTAIKEIEFHSAFTNLTGGAFTGCSSLKTVTFLNKNIYVQPLTGSVAAFKTCPNIEVINYAGTLADWNANESLVGRFGEATQIAGDDTASIPAKGGTSGDQGIQKILHFSYVK